jgi:hypothetical protein
MENGVLCESLRSMQGGRVGNWVSSRFSHSGE